MASELAAGVGRIIEYGVITLTDNSPVSPQVFSFVQCIIRPDNALFYIFIFRFIRASTDTG